LNTITIAVEALGEILRAGVLRIRGAASVSFCQIEADHLHNIPFILVSPTDDRIRRYLESDKPSYLAQLNGDEKHLAEQWYGQHWRRIAEYLTQHPSADIST
jgi:hypothetical protein